MTGAARLATAALALPACGAPCFFVDQTESHVALVRFDDGSIAQLRTEAPEGSRVCGRRVERARGPRRPRRADPTPRATTLDQLRRAP